MNCAELSHLYPRMVSKVSRLGRVEETIDSNGYRPSVVVSLAYIHVGRVVGQKPGNAKEVNI